MKKHALAAVITASLLQTLSLAHAADEPPFAADAELGVLLTSGNTESTALKGKLNLKQELESWRTKYVLEALYKEDQLEIVENGVARTEEQTTAEKYFASAQADYKLDNQYRSLFIFGSYEEDKFSGYDFQASIAAGFSDRLFQGTQSFFDYSVGPGISMSRTDEVRDANGVLVTDNIYDESIMVRLAALYQYDFSDNAKFTQTFSSDVALEDGANTKSKAETALIANINQSLAMKASFIITHNSEVPEDRTSTDRQTALTLVYTF
ncbi:DUF481 domain-containing protein [Saccharophagus sp. K07]|uniref:DUF481 domain-containing protein n=1 Tax=Saccharophagus sp. K07 TaxID=2283636 RepID=UPI0016523604|nr:DUF481 domain-containing protein [Saccharophagus sp. K07]MBC6906224.1 DUF481 domain-containing protein [Saccharophagus sp. K07]